MDMSNYKVLNIKRFNYIFITVDNFSKYTWCIPLKKKNDQTKTDQFFNNLTTSKRSPLKKEPDLGKEFHKSNYQNLLKIKKYIHLYSRFTEKCPSIA